MRWALLWALLLPLGGCVSTATVSLTFVPGEPGKGSFVAGKIEAARPQVESVTATREAYGRDCFDLFVNPDTGEVRVIHAVDATSDWAGIRVVPAIIPEIVSAVMAAVGAPFEVIGSLLGVERQPMATPSPLSACTPLYED